MDSQPPGSAIKETRLPPSPSRALMLGRRTGLHVVWSPDRSMMGRTFYLQPGHSLEIGRTKDVVKVPIADDFLSSRHVLLECIHDSAGAQRWLVTDLKSTNGVFVNGRRCVKDKLIRGDVLRIGATLCVFDFVGERDVNEDNMGMVGVSLAIADIRHQVRRIAKNDNNALIFGETGSGKELIAQAMHDQSERKGGPYVAINCVSINENLIESELFGYAAHAFSGASSKGHSGYFRRADGGTLFLDEIDKSSVRFQRVLLRVLQNRVVQPVGATSDFPVNVRVVAAANRDLLTLIDNNEFQSDVYYRLNNAHLDAPSLRERRVDIPQLFEHFLSKKIPGGWRTILDRDWGSVWYISDLLEKLCCYNWPGNVRELGNEAEKTAIAIDESLERGAMPLVPAPEICLSRAVTSYRCVRADADQPDLDPERIVSYQQKYSDPVLLQEAIDSEAGGSIKKFAELSAPYLNKTWEGARRQIYRVIGKRADQDQ
ncbi:MAG: sigma 54-interacting transcriptional regulator [Myxococcales bacterium]|nr:sigma 54-interacting transcriptional regulator [Myxococcales bacterium]